MELTIFACELERKKKTGPLLSWGNRQQAYDYRADRGVLVGLHTNPSWVSGIEVMRYLS